MKVKGKYVCDAYECNSPSATKTMIDGNMYTFCRNHSGCLDHSRAETIINMVSGSSLTMDDMVHFFNYSICGFSQNMVENTINSLIKSKNISLLDGCLVIAKDENSCKFPGCKYKKISRDYCSWHSSMPPVSIVKKCYDVIIGSPLTVSEISSEINEPVESVEIIVGKMSRNGIVKLIRSRPDNKFMVSSNET